MIPSLIALTHLTNVTNLSDLDTKLRVLVELAADKAAAHAAIEGATADEIAAAVRAGGGQPAPARPALALAPAFGDLPMSEMR